MHSLLQQYTSMHEHPSISDAVFGMMPGPVLTGEMGSVSQWCLL